MALAIRQLAYVVVVLVFVHFHVAVAVAQKALTLSIDCGAPKPYTDNTTGITWVPDNLYITTGLSNPNLRSRRNSRLQSRTFRYFPEKQSKFCYELPAINDTTYLVRTTFSWNGGTKTTSFQLQVDTSTAAVIKAQNISTWELVVEVITVANGKQIDVCLALTTPGLDVPFVNSIEIRKLGPQMYPKVREGYLMINSFRYNFGGEEAVLRYPHDPYDRLWPPYPNSNDITGSSNLSSSQDVVVENPYSRDSAPIAVMNTAMTWPKNATPFTLPFNVSGGRNYVVLLWFADIDNSTVSQMREFVVGVDGNWQTPINLRNVTGGKRFEAYEWGCANMIALSDTSYMGFQATGASELGPLVNAMEVYGVSDPVQPRTDVRDVAGVDAIKSQAWRNLNTWTGDPCLYVPYDWTFCSVNITPRISKLSLANNSLTGTVPNLSALQNLQKLHLQNNNLTGAFPAWVVDLTNLQELSVEGNSLTGYVPQSLFNNTSLKFTYSPSGLCTGPSSTAPCTALPEPDSPVTPSPVTSKSRSNKQMAIIIIIISSVASALGIIILACFMCLLRYKPKLASSISSRELLKTDPEAVQLPRTRMCLAASTCDTQSQMIAFSFNEVKVATNKFKQQISEGIFGRVYEGRLSDGREVAVKRRRPSKRLGFTEFFDEVEVLSGVHHRNITSLVGFCQEEEEQILIYEYLSNSDLRTHLHGDGKYLPWSTRLAIALDAAQGIHYLHTSCHPSIVHRDVKPSNILVTKKMVAKVANFGFATFTREHDSTLQVYSADAKDSTAYLDPVYKVSGNLTEKSDVYAFGVVLLELVSGQEPIIKPTSERNSLLIEWMRTLLASGNIRAMVDPRLSENYNLKCMWKVAELGLTCVEPRVLNRPSMTDVVEELHDAFAMEERHAHLATTGSASSSGPL